MQQYTGDVSGRFAAGGSSVLVGILLSAGLHAGALSWWLYRQIPQPMQLGMQEVTVELIAPPAPIVEPVPPAPPPPPPPEPELREDEMAVKRKVVKKKPPEPPKPRPPIEQPVKPVENPAPQPPAAAPVTQARYDADYLNNPAPGYPPLSRRLGEEGRVLLRVQVSADGKPVNVEMKRSSGFPRLDEAAIKAAAKWRFVPARQGDSALTSWVEVPIQFSLQK